MGEHTILRMLFEAMRRNENAEKGEMRRAPVDRTLKDNRQKKERE